MRTSHVLAAIFGTYLLFVGVYLWAEPPKTLVIGDSWALLAPIHAHKLAEGNASIERISGLLTIWPDTEYDRVLIIAGVANIYSGATIEETERDLKALEAQVEKRFNIKPIVADPRYMLEILDNDTYLTNENHINVQGYAKLFEHMGVPVKINPGCASPYNLIRHQ